jgi:hypothetical protein
LIEYAAEDDESVHDPVSVIEPRVSRWRSVDSSSASRPWSDSGSRIVALKYLLLRERISTK